MADRLTRERKKEIKARRRALRKQLKAKGIKSRTEYERIAAELRLVIPSKWAALLGAFWKFMGSLAGLGIVGLLALLLGLAVLLYTYTDMKMANSQSTISVSATLGRIGFDLSETFDFGKPGVRLDADSLTECKPISIQDLPDQAELDGDAGGNHSVSGNYFAYTFWVRNNGETTVDYIWRLELAEVEKDLDQALWIMVFDEGKQTIYSQATETGEAEHLSGYKEAYFKDCAANPSDQYYSAGSGEGIRTTAYEDADSRIVGQGTVEEFAPGDKHKYTVVMWVEGDDPECTNDRLGGKAICNFKFAIPDDDKDVFDDLLYDEDSYNEEAAEDAAGKENNNPVLNWLKGLFH